jgi:hypothetical protein
VVAPARTGRQHEISNNDARKNSITNRLNLVCLILNGCFNVSKTHRQRKTKTAHRPFGAPQTAGSSRPDIAREPMPRTGSYLIRSDALRLIEKRLLQNLTRIKRNCIISANDYDGDESQIKLSRL